MENAVNPCIIVIPALNPDRRLLELVNALKNTERRFRFVIVDDGSGEDSLPVFNELSENGCVVITHPQNMGKGYALKTAFGYIAENCAETLEHGGCVTADADGQHVPEDIVKIADSLMENKDCMILGVRDFSGKEVPYKSRWGNRITAAVFYFETGVKCSDTQTGLRGIPGKSVPACLNITGDRFEYEMNMLLHLTKEGVKIVSVPIRTLYEAKNSGTHFRPFADSFRIYAEILKFGMSSLMCAAVDVSLFALLNRFVFGEIMLSTVTARVFTGIVNFVVNRNIVFNDKGKAKKSAVFYAALFVFNMIMSGYITELFTNLGMYDLVSKMLADIILFSLGFYIQRTLIFKKKGGKS